MLGKSKKTENGPAVSADRSGEAKSQTFRSTSSARDEKTIIGEHISIEGSIRGEEDLQIEGSMKGNIELEKHNFKVGTNGQMEGEITARNVSVSGEFKGNIKSHEKVEVTREADFYGEIRAKSISVEDGAYIKGMIELDREPNRKSADVRKPGATATQET
jgi:cytoskeletal protein CcmA (bactofilin family)